MASTLTLGALAGCGATKEAEDTTTAPIASKEGFPSKEIHGIVPWGAGGGTDSLMRPLAELAEKELGQSIEIENKVGGIGSIATEYVYSQAPDGYTLLMGAENPQLYKALDITDLTYNDFDPVIIIGDETVGIAVSQNSRYRSMKEIVEESIMNPGTLKMATTGEGGLPWEVTSFLTAVTGATFHQIPYDSDASAKEAVLHGECDLTVCKVQSGIEDYKAGNLVFLSMLATEPVKQLEGIPLIVDEYPEMAQYLPWGPFYGIFVAKGTDAEVKGVLENAFLTAYEDPSYQNLLDGFNINAIGLTGDQATDYLMNWKKKTITALVNSDSVDKSLSELEIE